MQGGIYKIIGGFLHPFQALREMIFTNYSKKTTDLVMVA
jgi:hypothetical protein